MCRKEVGFFLLPKLLLNTKNKQHKILKKVFPPPNDKNYVAKGQSPLQELEEGPQSGLDLIVNLLTNKQFFRQDKYI